MRDLILLFLCCCWVGADAGTLIIRTIPICAYADFPDLVGDMERTIDGWMIDNVPGGFYYGSFKSGNKTMQAQVQVLPKTKTTVIVDVHKMVVATYTDDRDNIEVFNIKALPEPKSETRSMRRQVSFDTKSKELEKPVQIESSDKAVETSGVNKIDFGDIDGIFRIGQERNKTAFLDRKLKAKGGYFSFEKPLLINNSNFLLSYASYTIQNYTNPFPEIWHNARGDLNSYSGGFKYNFGKDGLSFPEQLQRGVFYLRVGWERAVADFGILAGNVFFEGKEKESGMQYGLGFEKSWGRMGLFLEFIDHRSDIINDTSFNFGLTSAI